MDNYKVNTNDLKVLARLLVKQTYDCWPSSNKKREELLLELLKSGLKGVLQSETSKDKELDRLTSNSTSER